MKKKIVQGIILVILIAGLIFCGVSFVNRQNKIGSEEKETQTAETVTPTAEPTTEPTQEPEETTPTPEPQETESPQQKEAAGPPKPESEPQTEENGTITASAPDTGITDLAVKQIVDPSQIDTMNLDKYFQAYEIVEGDAIYNRIIGKSYQPNDYVALSDLRYLKVLHYNFEGDYNSIEHNNTSAFCFRNATGSGNLSKHAYGRAIDINSQQNPYVTYNNGYGSCAHGNAQQYLDRSSGLPHVITHDDICYQIFTLRGFTWGGDWGNPKDFQHFEKSAN